MSQGFGLVSQGLGFRVYSPDALKDPKTGTSNNLRGFRNCD